MFKSTILSLITFVITFQAYAQFTDDQLNEFVKTASLKELVETNTLLLLDGEYYLSMIVSDKLLEIDANNSNFNYRKGFALIRMNTNNYGALPYLEKAVKNAHKVYDGFSAKENRAPIDSYFYLARCYHLNNNIEKAKENYTIFIQKAGMNSSLIKLAKLSLKQCEIAQEELKFPKQYELVNLGNSINSEFADYASVVSFDGQSLYFTSRRLRDDQSNKDLKEPFSNAYKEDVYMSTKNSDGSWGKPELLDFCLPERNEATVAVSADERSVYIYMDSKGNGDLFVSEFKDGKFGEIKPVDIKGINTEYWEPHISVSADGNTKYFSSDRPGGYGGRDIYRVVKLPNGKWSEPQNLGPTINSAHDEDAPFISLDNKTLYFASNGEESMGGFDIFVSILDENNNWSNPVNMGYPLNTTGDDIYYTTTANGRTGYLSSFRPNGNGEKDIYEIKSDYFSIDNIAVLTGRIVTVDNVDLPEDVAFTLKCLDCGERSEHTIRPKITDKSNTFISNLEPCRRYEMIFHFNNEETEFYRETFSTNCERGYDEIYREILLDVPTMTVILEPNDEDDKDFKYDGLEFQHFFGYNNNKISTSSGKLNEYLIALESQFEEGREEAVIRIDASASKVPTRTHKTNMNLAQLRANNIKEQLEQFIQGSEILKGRVIVEISKVVVSGPEYTTGSYTDLEKYYPHQFIRLSTPGVSDDVRKLESIDKEIKK